MKKIDLNNRIRNLARGGENYRNLRLKVFQFLHSSGAEQLEDMSAFLSKSFFSLKISSGDRIQTKSSAFALPLGPKDYEILEQLKASRSPQLRTNYLRLVVDYIKSNRAAVNRMKDIESRIGKGLLAWDNDGLVSAHKDLENDDLQSVFAFKLYAALHHLRHKAIADHFANKPHSNWVRVRLVYSLVFYFINTPPDREFKQLLKQQFDGSADADIEAELIEYLVRGTGVDARCLPYKCYIALTCHPYDALQMIVAHFEEVVGAEEEVCAEQLELLKELDASVDFFRLSNVLSLVEDRVTAVSLAPQNLPICSFLGLQRSEAAFFESYADCRKPSIDYSTFGVLYKRIGRLRFERYPTDEDFIEVVKISRLYEFSEIGRFLNVLLTSIYMVERQQRRTERTHLVRQVAYYGELTAFTLSSPSGAELLDSRMLSNAPEAEGLVERELSEAGRLWIKRFHWDQRKHVEELNLAEWFRQAREYIPLSGNMRFLSGVDWAWIDEIIATVRVKPFIGQKDGIYVLLLRAVEERQKEPNVLKLALRPWTDQCSGLRDLVDMLKSEYGFVAIAFVRFFLTPSMIMKMNLEGNYTAALSERLEALELLTEIYGFRDDIMTEDQFREEQRTLTTALTYMAVGAAQFEVPWESFRSEAETAAAEFFKAYLVFNKTYNELPLLTQSIKKSPQIFRNNQIRNYEFSNGDWPLVNTISSIFDVFLSHPSFGIESILGIRIRHDNLRREFAGAISELKRTTVADILPPKLTRAVTEFESVVFSKLQSWIDSYMHTPRGSKTGLFEFVPTQEEMEHLVVSLRDEEDIEGLVASVSDWIRKKLDQHLRNARNKLRVEFPKLVKSGLINEKRELMSLAQLTSSEFEKLTDLVQTSIDRKSNDLAEWFNSPEQSRTRGLTFDQMKLAVDGRFEAEIRNHKISICLSAPGLQSEVIEPNKIRILFDLWSELIMNSLKHSAGRDVRVKIYEHNSGAHSGLMFCCSNRSDEVSKTVIPGKPKTTDAPMLKTGNSGLKKVAALSATLLSKPSELVVYRRKNGFHVFVPLKSNQAA